jgi:hypothetical protein
MKRFPLYIRLLREYKDREGRGFPPRTSPAGSASKDIQVRKDLACTGVGGAPRRDSPSTSFSRPLISIWEETTTRTSSS